MSLTVLPVELVNDILSYLALDVLDKKCFALACKKFEAHFPSCRRQSGPSRNLKEGTKAKLLQLLAFPRRLQRSGNIFHGACPENHLCGHCARFRPKHFFPLTTMRFNNELTCRECTMLLVMSAVGPGTKITMTTRWGFDSTSYNCLQGISHDAIHGGHDKYGRKICEDCHLNICDDIGCPGWPVGNYGKYEDWRHFSHFHGPWDYRIGCICKRCPDKRERYRASRNVV